jgi:DNA-binding LacI/PurR family transcriptional regulator
MVTLKDVALRLGISVRSVSHAVNNTGRLAPQTRKLILETVTEMGYVPNTAARSLVTHRSKLIGVLVPFLSVSFYSLIISGLEAEARMNGYTLLLMNPPVADDDYWSVCQQMIQRNVDGIVLYPSWQVKKVAGFICRSNIPVVQLMDHDPEIGENFVAVENYEAAKRAAHALFDTGCRCVAMISHNYNSPEVADRCRGFSAAVKERMPGSKPPVVESPVETEAARLKTLQLLKDHPGTDGIFAASDFAALGAAQAVLEMGKKIPEDVSVIGFDNLDIASEQLLYPLSTVAQPKEEIGRAAGEMILRLIAGEKVAPVILDAPLIMRKTTKKYEV